MIISKRAVEDYLARKLDSHLWLKRIPKADLLAEVKRLKVRPVFRTEPWAHQLVCFWLGIHYRDFMFALGMGAGKTKIVADVFTQLQREKKVRRGLVIMPRAINIDSWENDLATHSDLEPNLIDMSDTEAKFERFHNPKGDLTLIDLPSLQWVLCRREKKAKKGSGGFVIDPKLMERARALYGDFIDIDESHKLVNQNSLWWQMVEGLNRHAEHRYGNTGTMFDADIQEAWTQMRLIDGGASFGKNIGLFRAAFMDRIVKNWGGDTWIANKAMAPEFHRALQHRSINYEDSEMFDLPKQQYIPEKLRMGQEQREHYLRAVEGVINAGGSVGELDNSWLRMRQITSGYLKWSDGAGDHKIIFQDNPKLAFVERILEQLNWRTKVIIICHYTDTGQLLVDHLTKLRIGHCWYYGGTKDKVATKNRFLDQRECRVMIANADAIGTGTDGLQKVCRHMVFYENPTPPKTRRQSEKRIHRPGMHGTLRPVYYDPICRNSIDSGIFEAHKEGRDFYETFMSGQARGRGLLIGR